MLPTLLLTIPILECGAARRLSRRACVSSIGPKVFVSKVLVIVSLLTLPKLSCCAGDMIPATLRRTSRGLPASWSARPCIDSGARTSRPVGGQRPCLCGGLFEEAYDEDGTGGIVASRRPRSLRPVEQGQICHSWACCKGAYMDIIPLQAVSVVLREELCCPLPH